ncbi:MAG: hypothetical protein HOV79_19725 [Hamadaea sp.]|nr:hypothetical protein [Hamadaea sp.]
MHPVRRFAALFGAVLAAMKTAYAELIGGFAHTAFRSRPARLGFAAFVLVVGVGTGFQVLFSAIDEGAVIRVVAFAAACTWIFGFGHTAALIARPAKSR